MKELAHPQDVAAPIDDRELQTGVPEAVREGEALPLSYSQQQLWFLRSDLCSSGGVKAPVD